MRLLRLELGRIRRRGGGVSINERLREFSCTDAVLEKDVEFFVCPPFDLGEAEERPNHDDEGGCCPEETYPQVSISRCQSLCLLQIEARPNAVIYF